MTDYTGLIERLRDADNCYYRDSQEAADALEAQARRIAELSEAIGLLTTLKPDMEIDANNPVNMATQIVAHVDARIEELKAALREAYEVYAGSDGFIPETAAEGYQQQLIKQMIDIIGAALAKANTDLRAARATYLGEKEPAPPNPS